MDDNNISSVCNSRDGRADEGRSTPPGIEFSCGRDGQVDDGLLVGTVSFFLGIFYGVRCRFRTMDMPA